MGCNRSAQPIVPPIMTAAVVAGSWFVAVKGPAPAADELTQADKLRALYSNRFSFNDAGYPLLTVEIMRGQREVGVHAGRVRPDGEGGAEVQTRTARWTVTVANPRPAKVREWTIVRRVAQDQAHSIQSDYSTWKRRGFTPRTFETGAVFGIQGEVIDSRETLVAIAPKPAGKGAARARTIARTYNVKTSVYPELVRRPQGMLEARGPDGTVVRNPTILWFAPHKAHETLLVDNVLFGHGGSQLDAEKREPRRYWGHVYVTLGRDGKLVVAHAVPAHKLLDGLVPAEMFPEAPRAALAAQAVAARTELLSRLGTRHFVDPFLLCSNQHCQVYGGAGHEHKRTTAAVRRTRGSVLVRTHGEGLVDARYSASCGGHTEDNEHIWGGIPDISLRGQLDTIPANKRQLSTLTPVADTNINAFLDTNNTAAYCGTTKYAHGRFRWEKTVDAKTLSQRVAAHYPHVGTVRALESLSRGVSGRIGRVRVRGTRSEQVVTGDLHIRRLFGGLRSTMFVVTPHGPSGAPTSFTFRGGGFGHGVGMCQIGAIGRSVSGQTYVEILGHYYPSSRVHRLY